MNAILDMLLAGQLTQDEYAQKKRSFVEEKKEIEMKLAAFARQGSNRFEPLIGFYKTAVLAPCCSPKSASQMRQLFLNGSLSDAPGGNNVCVRKPVAVFGCTNKPEAPKPDP